MKFKIFIYEVSNERSYEFVDDLDYQEEEKRLTYIDGTNLYESIFDSIDKFKHRLKEKGNK